MSDINNEKRTRFLTNLINESIINILAEQDQAAIPPATTPPASTNVNQMDTDVKNPAPTNPQNPEQKPFDVDEMVNKLNVLRGSKSFKDPEVYGRLTTFFKNLNDEQKTTFEQLLTELGKIVIDASEQQAGIDQQGQQQAVKPPPGGNNPQGNPPPPPPSAPNSSPVTPA